MKKRNKSNALTSQMILEAANGGFGDFFRSIPVVGDVAGDAIDSVLGGGGGEAAPAFAQLDKTNTTEIHNRKVIGEGSSGAIRSERSVVIPGKVEEGATINTGRITRKVS